MTSTTDHGDLPSTTRSWQVAAVLVAAFVVSAVAVVVFGLEYGRAVSDQNHHYLPAIRQFAAQWPSVDLSDYSTATTPAYLLFLAATDHYISNDVVLLRLVNACTTGALLFVFGLAVGRGLSFTRGLLLALPLVVSIYVFPSGVWILPDNAGWLSLLAVLLIGLSGRPSVGWWSAGAVAMLILVCTRQIHIWAAAVLWVSPLANRLRDPVDPQSGIRSFSESLVWTGFAAAATLPAFLAVGYFMWLWGGASPPAYQGYVDGPNPAVPATILMVAAPIGFAYATSVWPRCREMLRSRRVRQWLIVGAALGAVAGIVPATTYKYPERATGLWNVVRLAPVFADRSPVVIAASAIGGATVVMWLCVLPRNARWIHATAWGSFITAQAVTGLAWQRYYEPFAIILFALAASEVTRTHAGRRPRPICLLGPATLTLALGTVTLLGLL